MKPTLSARQRVICASDSSAEVLAVDDRPRPWSAGRGRRSGSAGSSCPSPTGPSARGTRPRRPRGRGRPAPGSRTRRGGIPWSTPSQHDRMRSSPIATRLLGPAGSAPGRRRSVGHLDDFVLAQASWRGSGRPISPAFRPDSTRARSSLVTATSTCPLADASTCRRRPRRSRGRSPRRAPPWGRTGTTGWRSGC